MPIFDPGANLANKVRGISVIFGSQSHYGFATVREMKYTLQQCCDKTTDDKMALHCECSFSNGTQSRRIK